MGNESSVEKVTLKSRGFFDIMAEMVTVCKVGTKKTHIMYKANLSHEMLQRYLKLLLDAGLVEGYPREGVYRASPKGISFVRDYEDLKKLGELYECKKSLLLKVVTKIQQE